MARHLLYPEEVLMASLAQVTVRVHCTKCADRKSDFCRQFCILRDLTEVRLVLTKEWPALKNSESPQPCTKRTGRDAELQNVVATPL